MIYFNQFYYHPLYPLFSQSYESGAKVLRKVEQKF